MLIAGPFSHRQIAVLVLSGVCSTCLAADREITFATGFQERVFRIQDGVFRTVELRNKRFTADRPFLPRVAEYPALRVSSSEFAIYPKTGPSLTAYDFNYSRHETETSSGGKRLIVHLDGRTVPLSVTLLYSTETGKPWMHKVLTVAPRTPQARRLVVDRIDVERLGLLEGERSGGGVGQPVFLRSRGHFFGLEYPEGHNEASSVITLTHYPEAPVALGLESKSAVWGVTPRGEVETDFLEGYLTSFALHSPAQPVITFNEAWNSGSSTTEAIARQSIAILKKELIETRHLKPDIYCIDSAWVDSASVLGIDQTYFPHGFGPVVNDVEAAGMELGLWSSLSGAKLDTYWGSAHGLEVVKRNEVYGPYCIAGRKYRAAIKAALQRYLTVDRVGSFKFDYNTFNCREAGHGHPTGALSAREAAVDAFIDILRFIHGVRPQTRIEITTGMWLSPWWLRYTDWVWLGGSDLDFLNPSGVPSLKENPRGPWLEHQTRAQEITYRDSVVWNDLVKEHYSFPAWGLMTHGFYNWVRIGGAPDPAAGVEGTPDCCNESLDDFSDHVVTVLLRGISDWEMLLNLKEMTPQKWDYLARGLRWGQAHWDVLSSTRMILGDPSKFQVYGYAHLRETRAIISLRNPANTQQSADLDLNAGNLLAHVPSSARQVYPCEAPLGSASHPDWHVHLTLQPGETKVLELGSFVDGGEKLSTRACSGPLQ